MADEPVNDEPVADEMPDEATPDEAAADAPGDAAADAGETEDGTAPDEDATTEPEDAEDEPAPAVAPEHEALLERVRAGVGEGVVDAVTNHGHLTIRVTADAWHRCAEVAKQRLDCEYLSFISAIDWMPRPVAPTEDPDAPSIPTQPAEMTWGVTGGETRFQVLACVESTEDKTLLVFKADLPDDAPRVASWTDVYPGADWHERECWEMYGITFDGHPHLRHLYLPGEFEGFPLRKDFPLLSREVKPWPGLVDVEQMPGDDAPADDAATEETATAGGEAS